MCGTDAIRQTMALTPSQCLPLRPSALPASSAFHAPSSTFQTPSPKPRLHPPHPQSPKQNLLFILRRIQHMLFHQNRHIPTNPQRNRIAGPGINLDQLALLVANVQLRKERVL